MVTIELKKGHANLVAHRQTSNSLTDFFFYSHRLTERLPDAAPSRAEHKWPVFCLVFSVKTKVCFKVFFYALINDVSHNGSDSPPGKVLHYRRTTFHITPFTVAQVHLVYFHQKVPFEELSAALRGRGRVLHCALVRQGAL